MPVFSQSADLTEACIPIEINFTSPGGLDEHFWDFGDGSTSQLANPQHIYVVSGDFEVELREGEDGPVVGTIEISLYEKPDLDIALDTNQGCAPLSIQFTNNSQVDPNISVEQYRWTYGDGTSALVEAGVNPMHTYDLNNTVNVTLNLQSNTENCTVTETYSQILRVSKPTAEFTTIPENTSKCDPPLMVTIAENNSTADNIEYAWDFGEGTTSDEEFPPSVVYEESGEYEIVLLVSDEIGCTAESRKPVSIGAAQASFDIPDTVCVGESVTVTNTSDLGTYTWDFGGAVFQEEINNNVVLGFPTRGSYTISLTVEVDGGCQADTSVTVFADQLDISLSSSPSYSCQDTMIIGYETEFSSEISSVMWTFWDGDSSSQLNPIDTIIDYDTLKYSFNEERYFTTQLFAVSQSGCTASTFVTDTIRQPEARFMPDTVNGCAPLTVTFSDSSMSREEIVSWEWIFGNGTSITADEGIDQQQTYTEPGKYPVELIITNSAGCVDTSFCIVIAVGEEIETDVTFDESPLCSGDTMTITNNTQDSFDCWSYEIIGGAFDECPDRVTQRALFLDPGIYDVALEFNQMGCFTRDTLEQHIEIQGVKATPYYEVDCSDPFNVFIADSTVDGGQRTWALNGEIISEDQAFTYNFGDTGDYVVILTVEDPLGNCDPAVDSVEIHVRDIQSSFELDPLQCLQIPVDLVGSQSQDVYASCNRGYKWMFTDQRPITSMFDTIKQHQFSDTGFQTVTLIVNDINGCFDTSEVRVKVFDIQPRFVVEPDPVCLPATLRIIDSTYSDTTITMWEWNINGQISEEQNPVVNIPSGEGQIPISVTVTNAAGCPGMAMGSVEIYEPESQITTDPIIRELCVGEPITFTASDYTEQGSFLNFDWDFGDGQTGTNQTETISYSQGGQYEVVLTFTEDSSGCMGMTSVVVTVQDFPDVNFSSDPDNSEELCAPATIDFMNMTESDEELLYFWDFGNGNISDLENPTDVFDIGEYEVQLIALTSFGCADTARREYSVGGVAGDFIVEPDIFCEGEEATFTLVDTMDVLSWSWDFGDGAGNDNTSPVVNVFDSISPGVLTASLLLFGEGECERVVTKELNINAILADFNAVPVAEGCEPQIQFINLSQTTMGDILVTWDFGDGTSSMETNPRHTYDAPGTYTVTLTVMNELGCMESVTREITVDQAAVSAGFTANPTSSVEFCIPPVQFRNDSDNGSTFTIDFGDGVDSTTTDPNWFIEHTYPVEGDYEVVLVVTSPEGCVDSSTQVISVQKNPDFAGGVRMPLAFTPNNDGLNDNYAPFVDERFEDLLTIESFKIFRRWNGVLVYDNENGTAGWDGRENGEQAPVEAYYYIIEGSVQGCEFRNEGDVTLIR